MVRVKILADRGVIFLAIVLVSAFIAVSASGAEVLKMGTPLKAVPHFDHVVLAAEEGGAWKQNGLEVQWVPFRGATDMHQAVAAGAIDVAIADTAGLFQAVARGVPELMVAESGFNQFFSIWVGPTSPIREPKDLKGARIGSSRFGASAYAFGYAMTKSLGLEKEVKFVAVGGVADRVAALKAGAIDAFVQTYAPLANMVVKGELREVVSMKGRFPAEWSDIVLSAQNKRIEMSPETIKRFVTSYFQATSYLQDNPDWSVDRLKSKMGYLEEAAREIHRSLRFARSGKINRKALENVREFILEYKLVPKEKMTAIDALYTTKFVE